MKKSFIELGISTEILKAVEEMGFIEPTEVQQRAIPHVLNKEDLIVMSKTGSGKTAAFGIPMLMALDPNQPGPQGLILTPTRELAVQVDHDLLAMSRHIDCRTTAVYGQHSMNVEIQALSKGASIVTGTPGRVFDHIRQGNLVTKHVRFLVLDEADRMLDMGFIDQVVRIIKTLPKDRVTLLFSATMPVEVRRICREYMKHPVTIEIESETKTVDAIQQAYYRVERNDKRTQLNRILTVEHPDSCMVFCNTRAEVDRVQEFLTRKGYPTHALHGEIPQAKRLKTIQQFKNSEFHILVATDVAARGIHVDDLSLVINYDVPNEKDSYVHRIGRTGRAGNGGKAVTLVTGDDIISLYEIEEHIGAMIPEEELPTEEQYLSSKAAASEKWSRAKAHLHTSERSSGKKAGAHGHESGHSDKRPPRKKPAPRPSGDITGAEGKKVEHKGSAPREGKPHERHAQGGKGRNHQGRQDGGKRPPREHSGTARPEEHRHKLVQPTAAPSAKPLQQSAPVQSDAKPSFFKRLVQKVFGK